MASCPGSGAGISAVFPNVLLGLFHFLFFFPQLVRSHQVPTVACAAGANVCCN